MRRQAGRSRSGFCVDLTVLLKIVFYGCPPAGDMHNPSGHTSLSTLVYGALALAAATGRPGLRRVLVIGAGVGMILALRFHVCCSMPTACPRLAWDYINHRHGFFRSVQSSIPGVPEHESVAAAGCCRRVGIDTPRPRAACRTIPASDYRVPPRALRLMPIGEFSRCRAAILKAAPDLRLAAGMAMA